MAFKQVRLRITGRNDLMMHSNQGVNPRLPKVKALKAITGKRTKTEEDLDEIARIEWELGLYHDSKIGPYLPSSMLLACLREAAKKSKQGKAITEAVTIDEPMVPLEYNGPRDIEGLYNDPDGRFFDMRPARVMGRTVNRSRPIFPEWAATFLVTYDAELIDESDLVRIAEVAGQRIGVGDYRPIYGRFDAEVLSPVAAKAR